MRHPPQFIADIMSRRRERLFGRARPPVNGAKECARRRRQMGTGEYARGSRMPA